MGMGKGKGKGNDGYCAFARNRPLLSCLGLLSINTTKNNAHKPRTNLLKLLQIMLKRLTIVFFHNFTQ